MLEVRRHSGARAWRVGDGEAWMAERAARVREGARGGALLSEFAPAVTMGRRAVEGDLERAVLESEGVEIRRVSRGGLATWHGPGQWVLYPVDSIERLTGSSRGVRQAVEALLEIAWRAARELGLSEAEIRCGRETGVWAGGDKVASVGIRVERGVLLHGLSINGFRHPLSFRGVRACGLDAPAGFLLEDEEGFADLGRRVAALTLAAFPSLDS